MDFLLLGKNPINPDQPAGSDVRYEPEFEALQAEMDKLASPSSSGGIEWAKVADMAALILEKKSKDLLVASYLAVSQVHARQIEGLALGVNVMHDLVENFWDTLFPPKKRMRGRVGAIEWWIEKTESALRHITPEPIAEETKNQLNGTLEQIDALFKEYLPEPPLLNSIQRYVQSIPCISEERPDVEPVPAVEEKSVPETTLIEEKSQTVVPFEPKTEMEKPEKKGAKPVPLSPEPEKITTEQDAQKLIHLGFQNIHRAAFFILENNPMDPMGYRYRRIAAWSKVAVLPRVTGGKTLIPPPPHRDLELLNDLRANGNWNVLLKSAEKKLSQFIFFFILNRYVAEALISLGEGYADAHEAVCQETAFFMHRLPGLDDLAFSDGMPFADPETKEWLKNIELGTDSVRGGPIQVMESGQSEGKEDRMAETIEKAQTFAKQKNLVEAVTLIQKALQNCSSYKQVFLWRLVLCQILMGSKNKDMSLPHLEQILQDIEKYRLETWDPKLALKGLKVAWTGFSSFSDQAFKHNAVQTLSRIAKLDPADALRLSK